MCNFTKIYLKELNKVWGAIKCESCGHVFKPGDKVLNNFHGYFEHNYCCNSECVCPGMYTERFEIITENEQLKLF